jgi:hypothetical protein
MNQIPPEQPPDDDAWLVRPFLGGPAAKIPEPARAMESGIRPFLLTQGRTVGMEDLAIEAQVVITDAGHDAQDSLSFEYRDIVALCAEPLAVAEIAARLGLHIGVTRVLIGDLKGQGMVTTFEPEEGAADDIETIMQVIHGLRQLS